MGIFSYNMRVFTENLCNAEGKVKKLFDGQVFVFGSNLQGHHAGGAARDAVERFGAVWGQSEGLQGNSYAIPTMFKTVAEIRPYVDRFIDFARRNPDKDFIVTALGCGIAGHPLSAMAGLFRDTLHLDNVVLPKAFYLSILAEKSLDRSATRWFARGEEFPISAFSECDGATLTATDHCAAHVVLKRGDKFGLFYLDDPMGCYGMEMFQWSVGPTFGFDEVLYINTVYSGLDFDYTAYVAVREGAHWSALALECDGMSFFLCDGESLEELTDIISAITGTYRRCLNWRDPFEVRERPRKR